MARPPFSRYPAIAAIAAIALLCAALGGCASDREAQPDIGRSQDSYKRSPCACLTVPQSYPPGWIERALGA